VEKGPPRHQTGQEIIEELNNLKISDGMEEFEGYGKEHNWTHKCGLWELPYSKALILIHNIDIMHQERNVAESIVMTSMNFPEKSKDKKQARKDLAMLCHRLSLHLSARGTKTQALFCMKAKERKEVMTWIKNLKFPDGFVAGFRRVVNLKTGKLTGVKSHDYHVIMEWLFPNMLRGYVHKDVWKTLAELSYFYRQLCAKEIKKEMEKLEKEIPVLLCKLEKIFHPDGLI
jgi:hypothetical protein